jgi:hypothetical protein
MLKRGESRSRGLLLWCDRFELLWFPWINISGFELFVKSGYKNYLNSLRILAVLKCAADIKPLTKVTAVEEHTWLVKGVKKGLR